VSRRTIAVFESKRGDGTFPDSFCGVFGRLKCVGKGANGTKSWKDTASEDIIGSTGRWRGQNKFHLGNVASVVARPRAIVAAGSTEIPCIDEEWLHPSSCPPSHDNWHKGRSGSLVNGLVFPAKEQCVRVQGGTARRGPMAGLDKQPAFDILRNSWSIWQKGLSVQKASRATCIERPKSTGRELTLMSEANARHRPAPVPPLIRWRAFQRLALEMPRCDHLLVLLRLSAVFSCG
jgi:hypothetical protein